MKIKEQLSTILTRLIPLDPNTIAFESLNDLDCNSGALYEYIINNNLNKKYKIIWLLKKENKNNLPKIKNVKYMSFSKKNIFDKIILRKAKFLIWDNVPIEKYQDKQVSIYLTHGFPAMKKVKGIINIPQNCDYFVLPSKKLENHAIEQFSLSNKTKFIYSGLPRTDYLNKRNEELKKITNEEYNKVIIWMPTFRKANNSKRNDSNKNYRYGLPILENIEEICKLNEQLKNNNDLLIIKIHGGQDTKSIKLKNMSNITIITVKEEKELKLHLYKLISNTDALITDYSSISFDYLLMNKPIGYIIDDINDYKLGFAFKDVYHYMAGDLINNFEELQKFIDNVSTNTDKFKDKRKKLLNNINDFQDNNNCKRIIEKIGEIK